MRIDTNHRLITRTRRWHTITKAWATCLVFTLVIGCNDTQMLTIGPDSVPAAGTWLVDENYIFWGCPGRDCIPSLTNPSLVSADSTNADYLHDDDLVVGIRRGNDYVAVPHAILDWHEIVNLTSSSVSYCPLTGSAIHIDGSQKFGVSGLLFQSNLIMYDKTSGSYWPQMTLRSAAGKLRGEEFVLDRMMETTWSTWRMQFPDTKIVSSNTGFNRDYRSFPYGAYRVDGSIFFPIQRSDRRLHPKARVLSVITADQTKAFEISRFDSLTVFNDEVGGESYLIVGSSVLNVAVAFKSEDRFEAANFDLETGSLLIRDLGTGSEWNLLGEAVSGSRRGERLPIGDSFISYWFALATFYAGTVIWEGPTF